MSPGVDSAYLGSLGPEGGAGRSPERPLLPDDDEAVCQDTTESRLGLVWTSGRGWSWESSVGWGTRTVRGRGEVATLVGPADAVDGAVVRGQHRQQLVRVPLLRALPVSQGGD